ncbi:MAG: type II secretion system protein [Candidatus Riflebacteria bacterium]|nr:type II secretion system protein [Candidatus Riflebacteria bacterium]
MSKKGFSLIELIVVIAILLAISFFALPAGEIIQVKAREKLLRERLGDMRRAIDNYVAARKITDENPSPYPPSFISLLSEIPAGLLKAGANSGPFLASESLGNPFADAADVFLWDVRSDTGASYPNHTDPAAVIGVYDVSYPVTGVGGWKKAIDETLYSEW